MVEYLSDIKVTLRPATIEDADLIGPRLRQSDAAELLAASGLSAADSLRFSIKASQGGFCMIAINDDGEPILIWGVAPSSNDGVGIPWMVATNEIYRAQYLLTFKKLCGEWVRKMNERFPLLINYVDHRNVTSILWLQALGFVFTKLVPNYGHGKLPFWEFMRVKEKCVDPLLPV